MCPCIIRTVASEQGEIHELEVTLTGMNTPKQFWVFKDFLRDEVIGVESVIPSEIRGDSMSVIVGFQGDGEKFINRVLKNENLPYPLHLGQAGERKIVLRLCRLLENFYCLIYASAFSTLMLLNKPCDDFRQSGFIFST